MTLTGPTTPGGTRYFSVSDWLAIEPSKHVSHRLVFVQVHERGSAMSGGPKAVAAEPPGVDATGLRACCAQLEAGIAPKPPAGETTGLQAHGVQFEAEIRGQRRATTAAAHKAAARSGSPPHEEK